MPGFILRMELKETDPNKQAAELSEFLNMVLTDINGIMCHPHPNDKDGKSKIEKMRSAEGEDGKRIF